MLVFVCILVQWIPPSYFLTCPTYCSPAIVVDLTAVANHYYIDTRKKGEEEILLLAIGHQGVFV